MQSVTKILLLTKYARNGASSRLRFMQYLPHVEEAGIEVCKFPLFSDNYVLGLQQGRRDVSEILLAYFRRLKILMAGGRFDLLWIEKEIFPWLPAWLENALLSNGVPYVLDYDDAVFHYYDQHPKAAVRRLLGGKHRELMRNAAMVVAGNEYLAAYARDAGAGRVEILPTAIDLARYPVGQISSDVSNGDLPRVGWIGQRATAEFLRVLVPLFERLAEQGKSRFVAIGIDAQQLGLPMESVAWSEATEVALLQALDIGIMPLVDAPFERGKCGYKLIQYMACGLPVVASPVGVNCQIVEHGVNGFLADSQQAWEDALRTLLADPLLRERMGAAGREKVARQYCIQVTGPKLVSMLKETANTQRGERH
jgi:glycosyltransferase involved in cell wall biosynthesis